MQAAYKLPFITAADYLRQERQNVERHEYLDGVMYMIAGESLAHGTICYNIGGLTHAQLVGKRCRGFSPNMKVRSSSTAYSYPDLMIVCGELQFHDDTRDVVMNPQVIFEVLSPSTEKFDRTEKRLRYMQIESLTDYILVSQTEPRIEHHTRDAKAEWQDEPTVIKDIDAVLEIESIDCRLPLADMYYLVEFDRTSSKAKPCKR